MIVNLTTVGIVVDLVCVIISFLALYGIRKVSKNICFAYMTFDVEEKNAIYLFMAICMFKNNLRKLKNISKILRD